MNKKEKPNRHLPEFHDPVARYLKDRQKAQFDGTVLPVISVPMPRVTPDDLHLLRRVFRQMTTIGVS
ncbi:MAG: hypothetical protein D6762_06910 [Candidatus Neomarinimicrobiota bacterium]|nr:MAG: hypothetical protein D6762_06910 [Candidatus Neomarinimicrobiota bacterium]